MMKIKGIEYIDVNERQKNRSVDQYSETIEEVIDEESESDKSDINVYDKRNDLHKTKSESNILHQRFNKLKLRPKIDTLESALKSISLLEKQNEYLENKINKKNKNKKLKPKLKSNALMRSSLGFNLNRDSNLTKNDSQNVYESLQRS